MVSTNVHRSHVHVRIFQLAQWHGKRLCNGGGGGGGWYSIHRWCSNTSLGLLTGGWGASSSSSSPTAAAAASSLSRWSGCFERRVRVRRHGNRADDDDDQKPQHADHSATTLSPPHCYCCSLLPSEFSTVFAVKRNTVDEAVASAATTTTTTLCTDHATPSFRAFQRTHCNRLINKHRRFFFLRRVLEYADTKSDGLVGCWLICRSVGWLVGSLVGWSVRWLGGGRSGWYSWLCACCLNFSRSPTTSTLVDIITRVLFLLPYK